MIRKSLVALVATLGIAAVVGATSLLRESTVDGENYKVPSASKVDLEAIASAKVFFAHQSVGFNMLDAAPEVYADAGLAPPSVAQTTGAPTSAQIVHVKIGHNGDPLGKIEEFDAIMRAGMADAVDVAVLKLCYVDIVVGTDVQVIFEAYRDTLDSLAADYPNTAFVAATAPLTTERGPLGKIKGIIGQGDNLGPEHNVIREQFNALMRAEYDAPGELFDVAAIESTSEDGERMGGMYDGKLYFAMSKDYASDPGHLNPEGAAIVTSAFLAVLADALAPPTAATA